MDSPLVLPLLRVEKILSDTFVNFATRKMLLYHPEQNTSSASSRKWCLPKLRAIPLLQMSCRVD